MTTSLQGNTQRFKSSEFKAAILCDGESSRDSITAANATPLYTPAGRKCPNSQYDWCKGNFREDARGARCGDFDPCDTTRGDGDGVNDAKGRPCETPDASVFEDLEADREKYFEEASAAFDNKFPMIEFCNKDESKEIDLSDFVKSVESQLEFREDFRNMRWVKWKRGVITIEPDEKTRPGEYELHVKMIGSGGRTKKKTLRLQILEPVD